MERKYDNQVSSTSSRSHMLTNCEAHLPDEAVAVLSAPVRSGRPRRNMSMAMAPSSFQRGSFSRMTDIENIDDFHVITGKPNDSMMFSSSNDVLSGGENLNQLSGVSWDRLPQHLASLATFPGAETSNMLSPGRSEILRNTSAWTNRTEHRPDSSRVHDLDASDGDGSEDFVKKESLNDSLSDETVACNVCGDTVAGFHCGAYVCEACKKFFVRCLKQDSGTKFTCAHTKCCEITKETRTQCPYCRFQKCLTLGMYRPGGPNVSSEIGHIPCKVCGAPSSGFHFGAITCEGCKGFFRRTVKERDSLKYQCSRNSSCVITWKTRNVCKMCRYKQCLKAGMKPDKSRIGRQPNSVKHATMLELNKIKSAKGLVSPTTFAAHEVKCEPEDVLDTTDGSSNSRPTGLIGTDFDRVSENFAGAARLDPETADVDRRRGEPKIPLVEMKMEELSPTELDVLCYEPESNVSRKAKTDSGYFGMPAASSDRYRITPALGSEPYDVGQCVVPRVPNQTEYMILDDYGMLRPCFDPDQQRKSFYRQTDIPEDEFYAPAQDFYGDDGASSKRRSENVLATIPMNPPQPVSSSIVRSSSPQQPDYETVISTIQRSYKDLSNILTRSDAGTITASSTILEIWDNMMTQFAHCAQATLKFAKKVPGFRRFPIEEQIHMIQSSMFPIVVVVLSLIYDVENEQFSYFMYTEDEMSYIMHLYEPFKLLLPTLHHMGQVICGLTLDETEVAFLCALHLMDSGNKYIQKELLLDSLEAYIKRKSGQVCDRNGQILMCLRDMVDANNVHQKAIFALLSQTDKYANLEIPQLFKESFITMDDQEFD